MHDSHIHLALSPLKENIDRDIEEFVQSNGKKILTQGTDILDFQDTLDISEHINNSYHNLCDIALGIHPTIYYEHMQKNNLEDIQIYAYAKKVEKQFEDIFKKNISNITAIGECGLDYYEMYLDKTISENVREILKEIQKNTFRYMCRLALKYNLPLSIHARELENSAECIQDALSIVAKEGNGLLKGSFHSYTGNISKLNDILDLGFNIGFNAIITYPNGENVRKILKETPLDRILFETDGPFLPTQSVRKNKKELKQYGRPVLIKEIIEIASDIKEKGYQYIEEESDNNYNSIFNKLN